MKAASGVTVSGGDIRVCDKVERRSLDMLWVLDRSCLEVVVRAMAVGTAVGTVEEAVEEAVAEATAELFAGLFATVGEKLGFAMVESGLGGIMIDGGGGWWVSY